jgi:CxxC-x17-CxxC domain-containing protein
LALDDLNWLDRKKGGCPVTLSDKTLTCLECGSTFTFTVGEQEFFAMKGYANEPKRCPTCREARKGQQRGGYSGGGGAREMYPVTCAECGTETTVPFRPRGDRPVYCSDCFSRQRQTRSGSY